MTFWKNICLRLWNQFQVITCIHIVVMVVETIWLNPKYTGLGLKKSMFKRKADFQVFSALKCTLTRYYQDIFIFPSIVHSWKFFLNLTIICIKRKIIYIYIYIYIKCHTPHNPSSCSRRTVTAWSSVNTLHLERGATWTYWVTGWDVTAKLPNSVCSYQNPMCRTLDKLIVIMFSRFLGGEQCCVRWNSVQSQL